MNARNALLLPLALLSTLALAQSNDAQTTTYRTPQGELVVHSGQPSGRDFGPPPAFAQLAHNGVITASDADAYPPLANDFIHADGNRDGRITKSEYERWAKSPH